MDKARKHGSYIIVIGKACNVEKYLDKAIERIIFIPENFVEELSSYFNVPMESEYFVYEKPYNILNIWPVDGCMRKCNFCRRSMIFLFMM